MAGNRCGHVPFLGRHVEVDARTQDFVAILVLGRKFFEDQRRGIEHSQLEIATRSKDMPLPIGFQGIGASYRKKTLVATQVTGGKAPAVIASVKSEPK